MYLLQTADDIKPNATETDYGYRYDNFHDFAEDNPEQAKELLARVKKGEWEDHLIYFYEYPEDFADHEVREGWYASLLNCDLALADYKGAPSLYNFIDFKELGKELMDTSDSSIYFVTSNNEVIETEYGWDRQ